MTETFFPVRTPARGFRHDWLKTSPDRELSVRAITIARGQGKIPDGGVVAKMTAGSAVSVAKTGGNTGDGTLTLDATTPVLADAKTGVYQVRLTAAAVNGGTFTVTDPEGAVLGTVAVGATWSSGVKFVIADGAADFIVGDGFDITVSAASGRWGWFDPAASDGRNAAKGLLLYPVDATDAEVEVACVVSSVVVNPLGLSWGAGVTTQAQKDAALVTLAGESILTRHTL